MQIKVGDLVYRKQNQYLNIKHNSEIWLVIGIGRMKNSHGSGEWIQIQNIHNGNRLGCKEVTLMKIETDKKCPLQ